MAFFIEKALSLLFIDFVDLCAIDELSIRQHSNSHGRLGSHLDPRIKIHGSPLEVLPHVSLTLQVVSLQYQNS